MSGLVEISSVPPVGRRERRKSLTRRELILAGRKLFGDKGLYESRVEDLTRVAGIAKGTLYQYFRNKDELIQAVVADGFEELFRAVERRTQGAGSLADRAAGLVQGHLDFFSDHPDLMRVLHQARGMLKFARPQWRPLRRSLDQHLDRLAALLGSASGPPSLSPGQRRDLALFLFGCVSGLSSVRIAMDPETALTRTSRGFVRALVTGALACAARGGAATAPPAIPVRAPGEGARRPARP